MITLGAPPRPPSSQEPRKPASSSQPQQPARPTSSQSSFRFNTTPSTSSQPSRNQTNGHPVQSIQTGRSKAKGKEREITAFGVDNDTDVEEDVRQMNVEADDLRRQSHSRKASLSSNNLSADLHLSYPPGTANRSQQQPSSALRGKPSAKSYQRDIVEAIPERETPQIHKNKVLRGERLPPKQVHATGSNSAMRLPPPTYRDPETPGRRRISLGMRGKRSSACFDSGVISTLSLSLFRLFDQLLHHISASTYICTEWVTV